MHINLFYTFTFSLWGSPASDNKEAKFLHFCDSPVRGAASSDSVVWSLLERKKLLLFTTGSHNHLPHKKIRLLKCHVFLKKKKLHVTYVQDWGITISLRVLSHDSPRRDLTYAFSRAQYKESRRMKVTKSQFHEHYWTVWAEDLTHMAAISLQHRTQARKLECCDNEMLQMKGIR